MSETMSEHAAAPRDDFNPEGDNYQPTPEEERDIKLVEKVFEQSKKYKSNFDSRWVDYVNMVRGKQWKEQRPSYRHTEVINLIFREIQSVVPIIMDNRPRFEYLPQEPHDQELSEIMNQLAESDWVKYNWLEQLTEIVYDSHYLGTGVAAMTFDPKAENGIGAPDFRSEDPFYIFPAPKARDVNKDCCTFIKAEPMSLDEIKKAWPTNGKYVKADVVTIKKAELNPSNKDSSQLQVPLYNSVLADDSQQYSKTDTKEALVITLWVDGDYEIEEEEKQDLAEDGQPVISFVQKKKYPRGRKIVIAGKVRLAGEENEYEDGKFPFARVQNYVNQRQFWGISEVEQLESPQKIFNKLVCFSLDVLTLMGNPVWKVGTASGVDTDNLFNQPGLIIEADDISQVQREEGVQLQPYVLQLIDRLKSWFDDVAGDKDVSRGASADGVTAASAIQSLQEAAQTRLRQKSRNLDSFLQNIGQLYLSRCFQFKTAPQVYRITGKDGASQFFKFHVDNMIHPESGEPMKVARYRSFSQNEAGQVVEGEEKTLPINGSLDVKVSTGTSLPFAKAENESKTLKLFELGVIDEEEVLKRLDYPNWQAVLQRVVQKKAEAAAQGAPPAA